MPGDAEGPRIEPDTYETLVAASHGFDWAALRTTVAQMHGTRPTSAWTLSDDWEAEWSRNSAEIGPSAVHSRLWAWIPEVLRDAWDSILEGSEVQLSGPPSFWTSPLAALLMASAPVCTSMRLCTTTECQQSKNIYIYMYT